MLGVLHYDSVYQRAVQVCVECIYAFRTFSKDVDQLLCLLDGLIALGLQDAALFLFRLPELLRDGVAAGYKNIRINEPLLFRKPFARFI